MPQKSIFIISDYVITEVEDHEEIVSNNDRLSGLAYADKPFEVEESRRNYEKAEAEWIDAEEKLRERL